VVIKNVKPGTTVMGVPAKKIIAGKDLNSLKIRDSSLRSE
jgi:serine acetyltransferase